ncbi:MAG: DUF5723 family protein [Candidatus Zhuqueibacterota bacterium]
MKNRIAFIIIVVVFTLVPCGSGLMAISHLSNPRSVGMAGAYIGMARGFESPLWNPANLVLTKKNRYSVNVFHMGVGVLNNSFSKSQYDLYNGAQLTPGDIDDILHSIPADGLRLGINTESQVLSFASGHMAFSIEGLFCTDLQLDKNFVEILFRGNEMDKMYTFGNSDGQGFAVLSYNLSGALPLHISRVKKFAVGATIKYLQGFGFMNVKDAKGYMTTTIDGMEANGLITTEYAGSGKGIGFDIGVASEINHTWTASLAFKNIISNIQWHQDATENFYSFNMDPVTLEIVEDTDTDSIFKTVEAESLKSTTSSTLPAEMRLGVVYHYKNLAVAADYIQGLNNRPGTSLVPQMALGLLYTPLSWLPLRTGFAVGGKEGFISACGFGLKLGAFALDFGVSNNGGFFLSNQHGLNLALGIGFWF